MYVFHRLPKHGGRPAEFTSECKKTAVFKGNYKRCRSYVRGVHPFGPLYVVRGDLLRVISLRKANQREVKSYVENAIKFQS
jgi:uncharacterized DUF497 family protein